MSSRDEAGKSPSLACRNETLSRANDKESLTFSLGTALAPTGAIIMAKRRAANAPLGLTSNGLLLFNVLSFMAPAQAARLRRALPPELGSDWFLGTVVPKADVDPLLVRLDDAAAEAAARFAGRRPRRAARKRKPSAR